jgi:hypothetical protein
MERIKISECHEQKREGQQSIKGAIHAHAWSEERIAVIGLLWLQRDAGLTAGVALQVEPCVGPGHFLSHRWGSPGRLPLQLCTQGRWGQFLLRPAPPGPASTIYRGMASSRDGHKASRRVLSPNRGLRVTKRFSGARTQLPYESHAHMLHSKVVASSDGTCAWCPREGRSGTSPLVSIRGSVVTDSSIQNDR